MVGTTEEFLGLAPAESEAIASSELAEAFTAEADEVMLTAPGAQSAAALGILLPRQRRIEQFPMGYQSAG